MPVLSPEAERLLTNLSERKSPVFAKPRVLQLVAFVRTLAKKVADDELLNTAFYLSATGRLTPEQILAHPRLPEQAKADCVALADNYRDAQAWRESQSALAERDGLPVGSNFSPEKMHEGRFDFTRNSGEMSGASVQFAGEALGLPMEEQFRLVSDFARQLHKSVATT